MASFQESQHLSADTSDGYSPLLSNQHPSHTRVIFMHQVVFCYHFIGYILLFYFARALLQHLSDFSLATIFIVS